MSESGNEEKTTKKGGTSPSEFPLITFPPSSLLPNLQIPHILEEKHQIAEGHKAVVTSRIMPALLREQGVASVQLPEIFDPGSGVAA